MTILKIATLCFCICVSPLFSAAGTTTPFPFGTSTKVFYDFSGVLANTYEGLYARNVEAYDLKCVHRPNSELPNDCVSEGIGYGMILAMYSNDQEGFNAIWDAGESVMWNGSAYDWRVTSDGTLKGSNAAIDAEIDVAAMLIFADRLVKQGIWTSHLSTQGASYASRAQDILDHLWSTGIDDGILLPGDGWGSGTHWNPAYFAPAFLKVFKAFDSNSTHNWDYVIDKCYGSLTVHPGYDLGMVPDWATHTGGPASTSDLGYNAFLDGKSFYKDAIRILWRLATDYAWFKDERAYALLKNAENFIGDAKNANFFNTDGTLYGDDVTFTLGNGVTRPRKEHSHLTVGQWLTTITVSNDSTYIANFLKEMGSFYEKDAKYWGLSNDPINQEDTLHNEMYFDQFLAWFGASLVSGQFQNISEDYFLEPNHRLVDNRFVGIVESAVTPTFKYEIATVESYDIYSITGELILRNQRSSESKQFDLPLGIYKQVSKDKLGNVIKVNTLTIK